MLLAGLRPSPTSSTRRRRSTERARRQFRYVTLPALHGVILTVALLDSIWTFRAFDLVYVMTGGGPINSSQVLATVIYFDAFQKFQFGYASAEAVVMLLLLMSARVGVRPAGRAGVIGGTAPVRRGLRALRRGAAGPRPSSLLVALATAITLFPVAWMATVSVRPNVEVMRIPPQWIPTA